MALGAVLTGVGAGIQGVSALQSLLKKENTPSYDFSAILNQINKNYDETIQMAGQKGERLKPLQEQYLSGMTQAQKDYLAQLKEREARYQAEAEDSANTLSDTMYREMVKKAYANLPQAQKLVREQLAGAGTFKTGSGQQQLLAPISEAAGAVATGAANLQLEKLKRKQQLISELNSFDNSVIKETFGFDKEALTNQLQFGTDAVVDEINNILSAMKDKQSAITGVVTGQANQGYAQQVGANQTAASKLQGWSNLGGILAGYGTSLTTTPRTTAATTAPTTSSYSAPAYMTDEDNGENIWRTSPSYIANPDYWRTGTGYLTTWPR